MKDQDLRAAAARKRSRKRPHASKYQDSLGRVLRVMDFPRYPGNVATTCAASRHCIEIAALVLDGIGDRGEPSQHPDDREEMACSILATVEALWTLRTSA